MEGKEVGKGRRVSNDTEELPPRVTFRSKSQAFRPLVSCSHALTF